MRTFVSLLCLAASTAMAGGFQTTLEGLATPTLGGDAREVKDFSFSYGAAEYVIRGGLGSFHPGAGAGRAYA